MAAHRYCSRFIRKLLTTTNAKNAFTQPPCYVKRFSTISSPRNRTVGCAGRGIVRSLCTAANAAEQEGTAEEYHSIIGNSEHARGKLEKFEFQAETRKLLDIVAKSLYSEKEVFIRELISNASDALEKMRYFQLKNTEGAVSADPLEIHIAQDEDKKTFTIQDTGIGMDRDELISSLGTIARSGSKAFLESLETKHNLDGNIVGQFGVGFYSTFMVADKVEVYTKSFHPDSVAWKWTSDGSGQYSLSEADGVRNGTKIVIHLKGDAYDYSKEDKVKEVIEKYSNFVGVPIYLNGKRVNIIQALWNKEPRDITESEHEDFYRYFAKAYDKPRYYLHYKTDAPISIRALFYVPEYKPTLFDMSRETDVSVALYSKNVLIMNKTNSILPRWLRFLKGVVDSEDIPLNLSRELLQDSALIRKLSWVLTNRLLKFFQERCKKDEQKYLEFYKDYGLFFREGIVSTAEQEQREEISKLLRFESSTLDPGTLTSLPEYVQRMKAGAREMYYYSAPSRQLAESSPYMEAFREKNIEVLFCYEPYDELVLMNLAQFDKKNLKSIENKVSEEQEPASTQDPANPDSLSGSEAADLCTWLQAQLMNKVTKVTVTARLQQHPCIVTVTEMGAARHFLRTSLADKPDEERYRILQPTLQINPAHPIMRKLHKIRDSDTELAQLIADQVFDNAMISAGLLDDPRSAISRLNVLLERALEKH